MIGIDPQVGDLIRQLRKINGWSLRELARRVPCSATHISDMERGRKPGSPRMLDRLDEVLGAGGALAAAVHRDPEVDELEARELTQRVQASDVGSETLDRLAAAVDDLATAYATTPPGQLLRRVRQHLALAGRLVDVRMTLAQHRQLLVSAGWLSLLAATVHIDLRQSGAGAARLATAQQLAEHTEHHEIEAWCWETRAWDVLTAGDYRRAVDLSQQAQAIAPGGSSALIQATAQEGRAWARMGRQAETRQVLDRVARLTGSLPLPDRPEHHYRYDPNKARSYEATTLAWAGDPAAEQVARTVVSDLDAVGRPRRTASARLDLALALAKAGKLDEACGAAVEAVASGRVVASNWWRVDEVMAGVERSGIREVGQLREVYRAHYPGQS